MGECLVQTHGQSIKVVKCQKQRDMGACRTTAMGKCQEWGSTAVSKTNTESHKRRAAKPLPKAKQTD